MVKWVDLAFVMERERGWGAYDALVLVVGDGLVGSAEIGVSYSALTDIGVA